MSSMNFENSLQRKAYGNPEMKLVHLSDDDRSTLYPEGHGKHARIGLLLFLASGALSCAAGFAVVERWMTN